MSRTTCERLVTPASPQAKIPTIFDYTGLYEQLWITGNLHNGALLWVAVVARGPQVRLTLLAYSGTEVNLALGMMAENLNMLSTGR